MHVRKILVALVVAAALFFMFTRSADQPENANAATATGAAPTGAVSQQGALKETVNGITYHMPYGRPTRPFTPAVQVGDVLYLAGQIGTSASAQGGVVPGGIQPETRQTMLNIKDVLEKSGSSMDHVFKCTVMLADMSEWDAMNEVYSTFFPNNKPARSALGANGLALNARVEIECLAKVK
ncbi:MAG TPA: RidA family protein [Gemmatimonadaceae bacterium]